MIQTTKVILIWLILIICWIEPFALKMLKIIRLKALVGACHLGLIDVIKHYLKKARHALIRKNWKRTLKISIFI